MTAHSETGASPTPRRFADQTAIVTGGGTGIGRAIAQRLAAEGADVLITGRREEPLLETAQGITDNGGSAWAHVADVSEDAAVKELIDAALERWQHVNVLVNNAGIAEEGTFLELSAESWRRVMRVNVDSAFLMGQAVARARAPDEACSVVNIASMVSFGIDGPYAAYHTSKHAMMGLTRAMAVELGPLGIRVNAVCPGFTNTEFAEWPPKTMDHLLHDFRRTPLRRMIEPSEVAAAAAFLASSDASGVTGTSLVVDGGLMADLYGESSFPSDDS